ncbi:hypothetical protein BDZ45DRAFT_753792 [Acephala macrosclerotiorum]|nr:hypothetical protein BDZ45DRAFT_753792 [Acephala macrosclerotiorum]
MVCGRSVLIRRIAVEPWVVVCVLCDRKKEVEGLQRCLFGDYGSRECRSTQICVKPRLSTVAQAQPNFTAKSYHCILYNAAAVSRLVRRIINNNSACKLNSITPSCLPPQQKPPAAHNFKALLQEIACVFMQHSAPYPDLCARHFHDEKSSDRRQGQRVLESWTWILRCLSYSAFLLVYLVTDAAENRVVQEAVQEPAGKHFAERENVLAVAAKESIAEADREAVRGSVAEAKFEAPKKH